MQGLRSPRQTRFAKDFFRTVIILWKSSHLPDWKELLLFVAPVAPKPEAGWRQSRRNGGCRERSRNDWIKLSAKSNYT